MFARAVRRQVPFLNRNAPLRSLSNTAAVQADFTHVVIGGGVIGLAIAQRLASLHSSDTSTLLVERHPQPGTETSSRNSEVIHAGIYYGSSSLKAKLCIAGKKQLYDFCREYGVPHRQTGKWIVAQTESEREALEKVYELCTRELDVPVRWVGEREARREEPDVHARCGVLESPTTGIVDSHALMSTLHGLFEDGGGVTALNSTVTRITALATSSSGALPGSGGWEIAVKDTSTGEESTIVAETLINCAGLGAVDIHNMIVGTQYPDRMLQMFYAKGNYFSYSSSHPRTKRLIYPAPTAGAGGLGTHLTLDMGGRIRFGPDVEWVDDPTDLSVNSARLPEAVREIKKYLPGIDEAALAPDYAGIRPKLGCKGAVMQGKGFHDFWIRKEDGFEGWVDLLGMESPGLTSCLAVGEMVERLLYGN